MNAATTDRLALITGGAGFVGTNVADRLLRDGWRVRLFDNFSRAGVTRNLEWLRQTHAQIARSGTPALARDVESASATLPLGCVSAPTRSSSLHPGVAMTTLFQRSLSLVQRSARMWWLVPAVPLGLGLYRALRASPVRVAEAAEPTKAPETTKAAETTAAVATSATPHPSVVASELAEVHKPRKKRVAKRAKNGRARQPRR